MKRHTINLFVSLAGGKPSASGWCLSEILSLGVLPSPMALLALSLSLGLFSLAIVQDAWAAAFAQLFHQP
jgi:hypothetical protein